MQGTPIAMRTRATPDDGHDSNRCACFCHGVDVVATTGAACLRESVVAPPAHIAIGAHAYGVGDGAIVVIVDATHRCCMPMWISWTSVG
jgi:hypothetical protein